ncbi:hypothetical protein [Haloferax sp. Atlit-6N]|uniref:hypothetical protein n=1 Tax=Haloferax sp. Atlit-6N TaxID=2077205 RepID=UPI0011C066BF|nr:hypothetical protein [Haloferax sp. Atlit-6N]
MDHDFKDSALLKPTGLDRSSVLNIEAARSKSESFNPWVQRGNGRSAGAKVEHGVDATPTLLIDGTTVNPLRNEKRRI